MNKKERKQVRTNIKYLWMTSCFCSPLRICAHSLCFHYCLRSRPPPSIHIRDAYRQNHQKRLHFCLCCCVFVLHRDCCELFCVPNWAIGGVCWPYLRLLLGSACPLGRQWWVAVVAVVAVGGDEARERGSCFRQGGRRWLPPHWRARCWHRRGFPWYGSQNDPYFENVGAVFLQREGNWEKSDKRWKVRR